MTPHEFALAWHFMAFLSFQFGWTYLLSEMFRP